MTTSVAEADKPASASDHSAAASAVSSSTPPPSNRPSITSIAGGPLLAYATRLPPGADLVSSMEDFLAQAAAAIPTSSATSDSKRTRSSSFHDTDGAAGMTSSSSSSQAACFVLSAVGSLECVTLRMANACRRGMKTANSTTPTSMAASSASSNTNIDDDDNNNSNDGPTIKTWNERLEIVSLTGTFSGASGGKHLHMSVSDKDGRVFGGHVISGTIYTTLELVVGIIAGGVTFSRELDPMTGYRELVVRQQQKKKRKTNSQEDLA